MASLSHTQVEGVRVVRLAGSLNHQGVPAVESAFEAATPAGSLVVVDLSDADLLATPGIALLISANQRVTKSAGGRLVITGASGFVDDLLRRCRLDSVLTIVDSPRDAVKVAKQQAQQGGQGG